MKYAKNHLDPTLHGLFSCFKPFKHTQYSQPVTDRPFILETVLTLILGNSSQTVLWYTLKSDDLKKMKY